MRRFLVTAGFLAAFSSTAFAAGPNFTWTGYYFGVHGGYGFGSGSDSGTVTPSAVPLLPTWVITAPAPGPFGIAGSTPSGGFGGFQLGYNWQTDRIIWGLETDFSFSGIKGSGETPFQFAINNPDQGLFVGVASLDRKLDWFSTFRGRLGYDFNPLMLYATAGLAIGHIKNTLSLSGTTFDTGGGVVFVGSTSNSQSSSNVHVGFAIGAGAELPVSAGWTARAEYLFISFADNGSLSVPGAVSSHTGMDVHLVRGAFTYLFGP